MACDKVDIHIDMENLSSNVEDLKREMHMQNQLLQLTMEGKKGDNKVGGCTHDVFANDFLCSVVYCRPYLCWIRYVINVI